MDGSLLQKNIDMLKAEGRGDREPMCGDDFQPGRRGRQRDNRGDGRLQVSGTASGLVRPQLAGNQTKYLEGEVDLRTGGETLEVGGSGSDSLGSVLSQGSTGGAPLQGRDMGPHVFGEEET